MITSALLAVFNNVTPQFSGDSEFQYNSYYQITETRKPDYQKLFVSGVQVTSADNCTTNKRMGKNLYLIPSNGTQGLSAYLFKEDATKSFDISTLGASNTYTYTDDGDIIAPVNCKIVTSPTSGGGHHMRLDSLDGKYSFVVEDMERWYCCRFRKEVPSEGEAWTHTVDISVSTLQAGQLIGSATGGSTVIKVYDTATGLGISWSQFYNR